MKTRQIGPLIKVADASFLAAQAKLADLRKREAALRQQLQDLRDDRSRQQATRPETDDSALKGGADTRWMQWIAGRQAALNAELAGLQVQKAQQFDVVKKAFGRRQAMRALATKSQIAARMRRDRIGQT